jgi:hypothetical protein
MGCRRSVEAVPFAEMYSFAPHFHQDMQVPGLRLLENLPSSHAKHTLSEDIATGAARYCPTSLLEMLLHAPLGSLASLRVCA